MEAHHLASPAAGRPQLQRYASIIGRTMHINISKLEALGWDDWFEEQARASCGPADGVGRVAAVDRDQLLLLNEDGTFRAKLSGKYMYQSGSSTELPCVGDWVCLERSPLMRSGWCTAFWHARPACGARLPANRYSSR